MAYKSPALTHFEWQQPVLDRLNTPPGGETKGDRYLIITGTDAWVGEDGNIATYNGAGWDFTDKKEGMVVYVMDENVLYLYIAAWAVYGGGDVTAALNLTDLAVVRGDGGAKGVKTSTMLISDNGEMINPSQPAFLAWNSVTDANATGDGTWVDPVDFDTEVFDQGGNYAANIFTAPVTGKYYFNICVLYSGLLAHNALEIYIWTSNWSYLILYLDPSSLPSSGIFQLGAPVFLDMDANDTAHIRTRVVGGAKVVGIFGNRSYTYFGGALIC